MEVVRSIIRSILIESISQFVDTNRYVYHVSNPKNRKSIEKSGLIPKRGDQWLENTTIKGRAIFATNSDNREDMFDSTYDDDIWQIDTEKIPDVKWKKDPNFSWDKSYKHIYTQQSIPKEALTLFYKGTGENNF